MSAFSTDGRHNAIVADALVINGIRPRSLVEATYDELGDENQRSIEHRYSPERARNLLGEDRFVYRPGGEVHPVTTVGLLYSWLSQSCEHPGAEAAPITIDVDRLIQQLGRRYPFGEIVGSDHFCWHVGRVPGTREWFDRAELLARCRP